MASQNSMDFSTSEGTVSDDVVSAVAARKGVDPLDLDPLYEAIDPDALDALYGPNQFGETSPPSRIVFTYCGCEVVVDADESITVSEVEGNGSA